MNHDRFISASAGTGKTYTISNIYVELFEQAFLAGEPLDVGNVVAITFTRKAAAEMKSRILGMMRAREGSGPAWQQLKSSMTLAWISTIDSFAQRILSEVGIYVQLEPDFQIGLESRIGGILERSVARAFFGNEELLRPILKFLSLDEIEDALFRAIMENRSAMIQSVPAGQVEAGLPLHSDLSTAEELSLASSAFKKLFEVIYVSLQEELLEEKITDFLGITMALKDVLSSSQHSWVRERYSRQFRYIIVDEFQDTDSLQKEILDLLRGEDSHIIYVGDAKQSIYRFRGAEVEVFSEASEEVRLRGGEVLHLGKNYRSHPDILEFCNAFYPVVFKGSGNPYSQTYESISPLSVIGQTGCRPRVKVLFDSEDEADAAARYILSLVGKEFDFLKRMPGKDGVKLVASRRPIEYRDIAILLRKMKPDIGRVYMRALSKYSIPYYTLGEAGFFEIPEIAGVLATLKVLSNPRDDLALSMALMSPVVGLDIQEMARLKYAAKASGKGIYEILGLQQQEISLGRRERLGRFHQVLERYLPIRTLIKPSELVERIVYDLDYPAFLASEDKMERMTANLRKFIITARRLDEAGVSLRELVGMLDSVGLDDEEQASIESEETDAVKIMTVHKAKGLEFPIVIVGDTSWSKMGSKDKLLFNKDRDGICFTLNCKDKDRPEETFLNRLMQDEHERDIEEEKRSLYVATTRASDMLVLTFAGQAGKGSRPWREIILGSMLLASESGVEIAPGFEGIIEIVTAPELKLAPALTSSASVSLETKYIDPVASEIYKEYVSPTAINETLVLSWIGDGDEEGSIEYADRVRSTALGNLAHKIIEAVGNGRSLEDVLSSEYPGVFQGRKPLEVDEAGIQEIWEHLGRLKDHPLVKEMESALDSRNEYQIIKPFGRYILSGRPDKVIKTPEGWKILDFKFSQSENHSEAYEFQVRFYLYIAREIFWPMLGAELFYLKDGVSMKVQLNDEAVRDFEKDLLRRIEGYQEEIIRKFQVAGTFH